MLAEVVSAIEFELMQGLITRDELSESIRNVRALQSQMRRDVSESRNLDTHALINRQFQLQDIMITLLHEMALSIEGTQLKLSHVARRGLVGAPGTLDGQMPSTSESGHPPATERSRYQATSFSDTWRPSAEIENAMRTGALDVGLEVRQIKIPVLGSFIMRVRLALHNLVIFYVNRLARHQSEVNRTYGERILRLGLAQRTQNERIAELGAQLAALQARPGGPSPQ